jgi:hypothetical protein
LDLIGREITSIRHPRPVVKARAVSESPLMFVSKRTAPAVVKLLVVLLRSAALPLAVLKLPVVLLKRTCPKTGVALRRSNPRQRQREK